MFSICRRYSRGAPLRALSRRFYSQRPRYVRFSPPSNSPGPGHQSGGSGKRGFFQDEKWPIKVGAGFVGLGVLYYVSCLEQVPETGRWRFMAIGPETEAMVGQMTQQQTYQEFGPKILPPDHPLSRHVRRVVSDILSASNLGVVKGYIKPVQSPVEEDIWNPTENFSQPDSTAPIAGPTREWDVIVVNEKEIINAAATPGTVIVFTGILPVCKDESGLAAVLSHEIGHVVARHTAERLSSQAVQTAVLLFLSLFGFDFTLSSMGQQLLFELPNSRTQEREADVIGMRLMAKACYNPQAAPDMFARLGKLEASMGRKSPEFMRTHPSSENRVKYLEEILPEGYSILAASPNCAKLQDEMQSFRDVSRTRVFPGVLAAPTEEVWS